MSTSSSVNKNSNNNGSCKRAVDGNACMTFTIENINDPFYDPASASFDLTSPSGPDITNQQSDKPLKSNGQAALENSLASELGEALANYIKERWDTFYFENGQSFEICADFAATVDAESGGSASADVDIGNIDITPQNLNF
jgi:hypothetical protein